MVKRGGRIVLRSEGVDEARDDEYDKTRDECHGEVNNK